MPGSRRSPQNRMSKSARQTHWVSIVLVPRSCLADVSCLSLYCPTSFSTLVARSHGFPPFRAASDLADLSAASRATSGSDDGLEQLQKDVLGFLPELEEGQVDNLVPSADNVMTRWTPRTV